MGIAGVKNCNYMVLADIAAAAAAAVVTHIDNAADEMVDLVMLELSVVDTVAVLTDAVVVAAFDIDKVVPVLVELAVVEAVAAVVEAVVVAVVVAEENNIADVVLQIVAEYYLAKRIHFQNHYL